MVLVFRRILASEVEMVQKQKLSAIVSIAKKDENQLLEDWVRLQLSSQPTNNEFITESGLRATSKELLNGLLRGISSGSLDIDGPSWSDVRSLLSDLSRTRALQGFSPTETATLIFSLKQILFERLNAEIKDAEQLVEETWAASELLDKLGLFTFESYQRSREEVIRRQQQEMLELSTPVIRIWDGVLAIPLIGTLDSARTQLIMENLLQEIVDTNSKIAILDITGVPTVDTQTAQHLIKTVAAARLMGAECIISGIRPQIAQTIVHLGIEINEVTTKASMADAVRLSMARQGWVVTKN